eukprot:3696795-Prymnesium_polylepis.1
MDAGSSGSTMLSVLCSFRRLGGSHCAALQYAASSPPPASPAPTTNGRDLRDRSRLRTVVICSCGGIDGPRCQVV